MYDLAHVAGWDPYSLHDLAHVSWVGSVLHRYTYVAPSLTTAGEELDYIDQHLSHLSEVGNTGHYCI